MEPMPIIQVKNADKIYPMAGEKFYALKNVSLNLGQGEFVGLVGPSGSGKTTLLNLIGALDSPSAGDVIIMQQNTKNMNGRESARLRSRDIGFVFQSYQLLPVYSVYENVEFPLLILKESEAKRKKAVMDALAWVGLADRKNSRPAQLSGGQCQRVAIARAIVKRPTIVLADEPTANLDAQNSHLILKTMLKLSTDLNTTFLFSTHDEKVIGYLKRKIALNDGSIVSDTMTGGQPCS